MSESFDLSEVTAADLAPAPAEDIAANDGPEILDPTTGELVPAGDIDQLIEAFERIKLADAAIYKAKREVQIALADLTEGKAKTRRVRGRRRRAKVEMPDSSWDQSILKEAFNSYPQFRDQCLAIASIRVRKREYQKVRNEAGPADFMQFRNMLTQAEGPPTGTPRVTIEE